jgi:cytochrome c oxidase cbb3-type subunit I/II
VTTDISGNETDQSDAADNGASMARSYVLVGTVVFVFGLVIGSLAAFQLAYPDIASGSAYTTYGRLLPAGRILLINGWLPLAGIGLAYYGVTQITRAAPRAKISATLGLVLITLGALASAGGVVAGLSAGIPGQEGPVWARAISAIGFLLAAVAVTAAARQRRDHLGPSGWYLTAAPWWLAASAIFGLIPLMDGTAGTIQAAFAGVGLYQLFAVSSAVGLLYFAFSKISDTDLTLPRPLAALGFWSIALTWAFMGGSELIYSATPNWYETLTIAFAIGALVPVLAIVTDLGLMLKGQVQSIGDRATLRYGVVSGLALATATVVNLLLVWRATSAVVQYTTWTQGLEILLVLGGASFAIFAANSVRRGGGATGTTFHFSWSVIGLIGVVVSLLSGGIVTGFSWIAAPSSQLFNNYGPGYEVAVASLAPFLLSSGIFFAIYVLAQIAYLIRIGSVSDTELELPETHLVYNLEFEGTTRYVTWKGLVWGAALVWISAAVFTAVLPILDDTDTAATATADRYRTYEPDSLELAGRDLYISEGCTECHTQSVRPIVTDVGLGAVSLAGDYANENPAPITGTRLGPDLMHVASRDEFFDTVIVTAHLKDPQSVVDWSTMPSYAYLSDADISAIVSYIETLR